MASPTHLTFRITRAYEYRPCVVKYEYGYNDKFSSRELLYAKDILCFEAKVFTNHSRLQTGWSKVKITAIININVQEW